MSTERTFKIMTLGCKVNQYESQLMREGMSRAGYKEENNGQPVDVYIVNTCTVTEKADIESLRLIRRLAKFSPDAKIMATGCYAEQALSEIGDMPNVTLLRNSEKNRIAGFVELRRSQSFGEISCISDFGGRSRAYVKIQDGCDNRCAFCKVWMVRGRPNSRPLEEIIDEARGLVEKGFREIVLTGICLGAYGKDLPGSRPAHSVCDVIEKLQELKGNFRIRLSSIEMTDVSERLIELLSDSDKLCPHLHIPLQSGDDEILRRMNRRYSVAEFIETADKLRASAKDIAITTDVIIGFPGETQRHFENTLGAVKHIEPLKVHIFPFSPREGTPAFDMAGRAGAAEIKERISSLEEIARAASLNYKTRFLNKGMRVLVEHKKRRGLLSGYADNYIRVDFEGPSELLGEFARVSIKSVRDNFVEGVLWT